LLKRKEKPVPPEEMFKENSEDSADAYLSKCPKCGATVTRAMYKCEKCGKILL